MKGCHCDKSRLCPKASYVLCIFMISCEVKVMLLVGQLVTLVLAGAGDVPC